MAKEVCVRKNPCSTCPYRKSTPSGVWSEEEYDKLPRYDKETYDQPTNMFFCHSTPDDLCAGWVAAHDAHELLSLRLSAAAGRLSLDVFEYSTSVPLHGSGAEAAAYGKLEIENPTPEAVLAATKVGRLHRTRPAKERA